MSTGSAPMNYAAGSAYGLPESCRVHRLANIAGRLRAGENCRIDAFTTITGDVRIGERVHIGTGAAIFGTGGVTIGDGTSVSPGAKIFSATEDPESGLASNPMLDPRYARTAPVIIGARAVIGANSVVLPGICVGDDTLVGALSLVNATLPAGWICAGVPAGLLRRKPRQMEKAA